MTGIVVDLFTYSGSISTLKNYFKAFKDPHFGPFGRTGPYRSLKLGRFGLELFQSLSTSFSWVAS